jgi:hypothetical protein
MSEITDDQRRSQLKLLNNQMLELMLTITEDKDLARMYQDELEIRRLPLPSKEGGL